MESISEPGFCQTLLNSSTGQPGKFWGGVALTAIGVVGLGAIIFGLANGSDISTGLTFAAGVGIAGNAVGMAVGIDLIVKAWKKQKREQHNITLPGLYEIYNRWRSQAKTVIQLARR